MEGHGESGGGSTASVRANPQVKQKACSCAHESIQPERPGTNGKAKAKPNQNFVLSGANFSKLNSEPTLFSSQG